MKNASLEYLKREPSRQLTGSSPLLILLHGLGSDEHDLFSFAPHLDARYRILSVRAPRIYPYRGFAWFDLDFSGSIPLPNYTQIGEAREVLLSFIREVSQLYNASRIYLAGFSQGAIMSYLTALTHPSLVAGVLTMSGYIVKSPMLPTVASEELKALSIFATHGINDRVLPVFLGRSTRDYLESLQLNFTYQEYLMGHEVNQVCFEDCKAWLARQVADLT